MGIGVDNNTVRAHTQPGSGANDYRLHWHRDDDEDTSPTATNQSGYESLKSAAAQSQSAFDSTAAGLFGSWYSSLNSTRKQGFREVFTRL